MTLKRKACSMTIKNFILIIAAVTMMMVFINAGTLRANGMNRAMNISGLGASVDFTYGKDLIDSGVYLSYRGGIFHIVSFPAIADVGYRFVSQSVHGRFGGNFLIMFAGLEAGFTMSYKIQEGKNIFFSMKNLLVNLRRECSQVLQGFCRVNLSTCPFQQRKFLL